jgi:quinol monooxygenase YgiN
MIIRIVRMTFRPEAVPEFLRLFRATEDRIRQQPGCRHMELWQDAEQPHVFGTHSHWDSAADLDAYRRSALFGEVWPATKRLFAAPPLAYSVHTVTADTARLPPVAPALPDSVL